MDSIDVRVHELLFRVYLGTAGLVFEPKQFPVYSENKIAWSLYTKLGFRAFARFPNWTLHRGKYRDHLYMILKK